MKNVVDIEKKINELDIKPGELKEEQVINYINKENLDNLITKTERQIEELKKEINNLKIDIESGYFYKIRTFLSLYEQYFLESKKLFLFENIANSNEIIDINKPIVTDESLSFNSELKVINDEYYLFILPEMVGEKEHSRHSRNGYFHQNIVINLLQKHFEKIDFNYQIMTKALVVFEYHIQKNDNFSAPTDLDNADTKKCIDGINGLLIENDTVNNINIIYIAIPDKKNYTKMHVINNNYAKTWLQNNIDLFT